MQKKPKTKARGKQSKWEIGQGDVVNTGHLFFEKLFNSDQTNIRLKD